MTMPYAEVRAVFGNHTVRTAEVPVEHALSLPLPTLRWTVPGFAAFSGPAERRPGRPPRYAVPDRWWLLDATRARLITYNLIAAVPFCDVPLGEPVDAPAPTRTLAETREDLRTLEELMDVAAPGFLHHGTVDRDHRAALLHTLDAVLPAATRQWYEVLTPDFFTWLKG